MSFAEQPGFVLWFTGLSGSGKSTLATLCAAEFERRGLRFELLDGDELRTHLSKGLSFSREDRDTNVRRIGYVAKLLARNGVAVITAAISPYREVRAELRGQIENFAEVYTSCSIEALAARDPKGLYKKALAGEIAHFTGVSDPYEAPEDPELRLNTERESQADCVARIVNMLDEKGWLDGKGRGGALPRVHGGELGSVPVLDESGEGELTVGEETLSLLQLAAEELLLPVIGAHNDKDRTRIAKDGRLESGARFPCVISLPSQPAGAVFQVAGSDSVLVRDGMVARRHAGPSSAQRIRRWLACSPEPERAVGLFLETSRSSVEPQRLSLQAEALLARVRESASQVVLFACGAARQGLPEAGLDESLIWLPLPSLTRFAPRERVLLQAIVCRNAGLRRMAFQASERDRILMEQTLLAAAEIPVVVHSSGPGED